MLDLSNHEPPLDLRLRIERYKKENSPADFTEHETLCVSGMLRRNKPLTQYLQDRGNEEDIFETTLLRLIMDISQDASKVIPGLYAGYAYLNKFILFYHPKLVDWPLNRDNAISLVSSRVVNYTNRYYANPMCLISLFQIPSKEVKNVLAYYKMSWLAKRNRLLGQQILGIDSKDTTLEHHLILERVIKRGFSLKHMTPTLRDGFFFSPHVSGSEYLEVS